MARLLSVNVGLPQDIAWQGRTVHTAVWKRAATGRRMARRLNLDGDGQGDLVGHGGEHRAVFVYQIESYRYWERELGRSDFTFGQFGENFTVEGLPDDAVCIGDRDRIGGAVFEVTQPRVTCYRVGIRMDEPRMAALLTGSGRTGFYFRMLEEGEVGAGDEIVKLAPGSEQMSVARINALLYLPGHRREELERALRIPALSAGWAGSFQAMLEQKSGLAPSDVSRSPPAWPGFRPLRVAAKRRESADVLSLALQPADALPLATPLPGQFIVLRLQSKRDTPPLLRSYSLSGAPDAGQYRLGIKLETSGAAGIYLDRETRVGDTCDTTRTRWPASKRCAPFTVTMTALPLSSRMTSFSVRSGRNFSSSGSLKAWISRSMGTAITLWTVPSSTPGRPLSALGSSAGCVERGASGEACSQA